MYTSSRLAAPGVAQHLLGIEEEVELHQLLDSNAAEELETGEDGDGSDIPVKRHDRLVITLLLWYVIRLGGRVLRAQ